MKSTTIKLAVGLFSVALSGAVLAQQIQEVTVQASRNIEKHQVGRSSSGVPIVDISLSYGVSYAGLDLVSHAGFLELQKRVNDAALQACKELNRQYPIGAPDEKDCAKAAADAAMVKVNELTAAAKPAAK